MRSIKENFERAGLKATREASSYSLWPVFEEYEVERVSGELFVTAVIHPLPSDLEEGLDESWEDLPAELSAKAQYSPQYDYPDLFLRFARLVGRNGPQTEDEMLDMALSWIQTYGVLGVEGVDPLAYRGTLRAGRRESVTAFSREARRAAVVLDAFEAANSGDPEMMRDWFEKHARVGSRGFPEKMRAPLVEYVSTTVREYIERYCFPTIYSAYLMSPTPAYDYLPGWGFTSLLGAMYLQMRFYALEPGRLRICKAEDCSRIVTFESGTPPKSPRKGARGKYRTRADKVYCEKACGQRMRDQSKKKGT